MYLLFCCQNSDGAFPEILVQRFGDKITEVASAIKPVAYPSTCATLDDVAPTSSSETREFVPLRSVQQAVDTSPMTAYQVLLGELFGESVIIADSKSSESLFGERFEVSKAAKHSIGNLFSDASEFCLGVHLARVHRRQQLAESVGTYIASSVPNDQYALRDALSAWYKSRDDGAASRRIGDKVCHVVETRFSIVWFFVASTCGGPCLVVGWQASNDREILCARASQQKHEL